MKKRTNCQETVRWTVLGLGQAAGWGSTCKYLPVLKYHPEIRIFRQGPPGQYPAGDPFVLDLLATMEEARAEEEEAIFENLPQSRQGAAEHNVTPEGYSTAWLNAARGRILGPARAQEVQRGDSITLSVFGKYVDKRKVRLLPASLVKAKAGPETLRQLTELGQQYRAAGPNQLLLYHAVHLVLADLQRKPVPEAYMGYALYCLSR